MVYDEVEEVVVGLAAVEKCDGVVCRVWRNGLVNRGCLSKTYLPYLQSISRLVDK